MGQHLSQGMCYDLPRHRIHHRRRAANSSMNTPSTSELPHTNSWPSTALKYVRAIIAIGALFGGLTLIAYLNQIGYVPQITLDTIGSIALLIPLGAFGVMAMAVIAIVVLGTAFLAIPPHIIKEEEDRKKTLFSHVGLQLITILLWWCGRQLIDFRPDQNTSYTISITLITLLAVPFLLSLLRSLGTKYCGSDRCIIVSQQSVGCALLGIGAAELFPSDAPATAFVPSLTMLCGALGLLFPSLLPIKPFSSWPRKGLRIAGVITCLATLFWAFGMPAKMVGLAGFGNRDVIVHWKPSAAQSLSQLSIDATKGTPARMVLNLGSKVVIDLPAAEKESGPRRVEIPRDYVDTLELTVPHAKSTSGDIRKVAKGK